MPELPEIANYLAALEPRVVRQPLERVRLREDALGALDPGGVEPLEVDLETFRGALARENHALKRALTDPRLISGIGNAHSACTPPGSLHSSGRAT